MPPSALALCFLNSWMWSVVKKYEFLLKRKQSKSPTDKHIVRKLLSSCIQKITPSFSVVQLKTSLVCKKEKWKQSFHGFLLPCTSLPRFYCKSECFSQCLMCAYHMYISAQNLRPVPITGFISDVIMKWHNSSSLWCRQINFDHLCSSRNMMHFNPCDLF